MFLSRLALLSSFLLIHPAASASFSFLRGSREVSESNSTFPIISDESDEGDDGVIVPTGRSLLVHPPKSVETALVIRILGVDSNRQTVTPILSEAEAFQRAFATSDSAAAQLDGCSGGYYKLVPFQHARLSTAGVLSVHVRDIPYSDHDKNSIRKQAEESACILLGFSDSSCNTGADHLLFIMPYGLSDGSDVGFLSASVGGDYSIYGDSSPQYNAPSFSIEGILHELMHNFRIGHAYYMGNSYGDNSSPMGGSYYLWGEGNGNNRCYNGYHVWALNWHKERVIEIPVGESATAKIKGFAESRLLKEDEYLTIKYGDFFVMYNRMIGINAATKSFPDKVLIHESRPRREGSSYIDTHLVGYLSQADEITLGSFRVKLCGSGGDWPLSTVTIAVGAGASCYDKTVDQQGYTEDSQAIMTPSPTPFPTQMPTPRPTLSPTPSPTQRPTPSPTRAPTPFPTPAPTREPTSSPTRWPTPFPTPAPTHWPTPSPTAGTHSPTMAPTPRPTPFPTSAPTRSPTPFPTGGQVSLSTEAPSAVHDKVGGACTMECATDSVRVCIVTFTSEFDRCIPTGWLDSIRGYYPDSYCGHCDME